MNTFDQFTTHPYDNECDATPSRAGQSYSREILKRTTPDWKPNSQVSFCAGKSHAEIELARCLDITHVTLVDKLPQNLPSRAQLDQLPITAESVPTTISVYIDQCIQEGRKFDLASILGGEYVFASPHDVIAFLQKLTEILNPMGVVLFFPVPYFDKITIPGQYEVLRKAQHGLIILQLEN